MVGLQQELCKVPLLNCHWHKNLSRLYQPRQPGATLLVAHASFKAVW